MSSRSPTQSAKALVLLSEQKYLEKHLGDPESYFMALTKHSILTKAKCEEIRQQRSMELSLQRCLELVSMNQRGFDVLVQAMTNQRKHSTVARYLQRKVKEMEVKLCEQGEISDNNYCLLLIHSTSLGESKANISRPPPLQLCNNQLLIST